MSIIHFRFSHKSSGNIGQCHHRSCVPIPSSDVYRSAMWRCNYRRRPSSRVSYKAFDLLKHPLFFPYIAYATPVDLRPFIHMGYPFQAGKSTEQYALWARDSCCWQAKKGFPIKYFISEIKSVISPSRFLGLL